MTDPNPVQPALHETVQEAVRVAVLEAIDETTQALLGAKMSDAELTGLFRTLDAISERLCQLHAPSTPTPMPDPEPSTRPLADPFERYAAKAEANGSHDVAARLRIEGRVARTIVDKALADNLCVSVIVPQEESNMPRRITERTAERLVRLAYELEQLAGTLTREGHESIGGGVRQISSGVGLMGRRLFDDLNRKGRT